MNIKKLKSIIEDLPDEAEIRFTSQYDDNPHTDYYNVSNSYYIIRENRAEPVIALYLTGVK